MINFLHSENRNSVSVFAEKTIPYIISLLVFLLPLSKKAIPFLILFWALMFILEGRFSLKVSAWKRSWFFWAFLLFYFWHLISFFYSENKTEGSFDLQVKLSFLVFPFLLTEISNTLKNKTTTILYAFVAGNFIAGIICLASSLVIAYNTIQGVFIFDAYQIRYEWLSGFIHVSYFSLYCIFSIFILTETLRKKKKLSFTKKTLIVHLILFFVVFVYLLWSRAGIITLALCLIIYFFLIIKTSRRYWFIKPAVLVGFCLMFLFLINNDERFNIFKVVYQSEKVSNLNLRFSLWSNAFEIIQQQPLFGVGCGDIHHELNSVYKTNQVKEAYEKKLNVHNQYIETWLGQGIFALLTLLLILYIGLYDAIKKKNMLSLIFMIIFIINMIFESLFNMQSGIVWVVLFIFLLQHISIYPPILNGLKNQFNIRKNDLNINKT